MFWSYGEDYQVSCFSPSRMSSYVFMWSIKGITCLESTTIFVVLDIPDTFGLTLKLMLALYVTHTVATGTKKLI